jgi:hypothetical protein
MHGFTEKFGFLGLLFPAEHGAATPPIVGTLGPVNRIGPKNNEEVWSVQRYP